MRELGIPVFTSVIHIRHDIYLYLLATGGFYFFFIRHDRIMTECRQNPILFFPFFSIGSTQQELLI